MQRRLFLASSLLLLATGSVPAIAQRSVAPSPALQAQAQPAAQAEIEILSPGAAQSRQRLRYQPAINTKEVATMTLDMDLKTQVGGSTVPNKAPSSIVKMETTVDKVDSNGDIHYGFRYISMDVANDSAVSPVVLNAMRSRLKKLEGISGTAIVDERGQTKSANIKLPANLEPSTKQFLNQLQDSLKNLTVGLPAEPVGVGAKWRVAQPLQVYGISLTSTATYELVSLDQAGATMKISLEQNGRAQRLALPNFPPSVVISLKSMKSTGQGSTVLRWNRLLPTQSTALLNSKIDMEISQSATGTPRLAQSETTVQIKLESD